MMAKRAQPPQLIGRLPGVRGVFTPDAPLAPLTWFRAGGSADILFEPADVEDLSQFLGACPADIPLTVIGAGSNLLVRDGGVRGVCIRLGRTFGEIRVTPDGLVSAGASVMDVKAAVAARDAGFSGLEFLRGVPGNLGGAVWMNAGAYGGEIKDVFVWARGFDARGRLRQFDLAQAGFSYRHSSFPPGTILTEICLRGAPGSFDEISARMAEIASARSDAQPVGARTGGSTFANPDERLSGGRKAWELIDAAGGRGLRIGDAMVSEKHCNFLINCGQATAHDLESLGEELRKRVVRHTGVTLEWEIRRIGELSESQAGGGA